MKTSGPNPWSDAYTAKHGYMVSTFFKFAVRLKLIDENPFKDGVGIKKKQYAKPKYFDPESDVLKKILVCSQSLQDRAIIWTLYSCAGRTSEVANLHISDVLDEEIHIINGKGGKSRFAPICPKTKQILGDHIEALKASGYSGKWLFPSRVGNGPIRSNTILRMLHRLRDRLGLDALYPRMFRHSFAFRKISNGAQLFEVKEWLGHEDIRTTMIYTHPTRDFLRKRNKETMGAA